MEDQLVLGPDSEPGWAWGQSPGPGRTDLHAAGELASSADHAFVSLFNGSTSNAAVSESGWRAIGTFYSI